MAERNKKRGPEVYEGACTCVKSRKVGCLAGKGSSEDTKNQEFSNAKKSNSMAADVQPSAHQIRLNSCHHSRNIQQALRQIY